MSMQQVRFGELTEDIERVATDLCQMHLVLFDGECPLCNRAVRFLLRIDRDAKLMFAPLRGTTALAIRPLWINRDESIILISHLGTSSEKVFDKSDAILEILRIVGGWWRALLFLSLVPPFVRNFLYDVVARRRYGWFGRYDEGQCPTVPVELRSRFLP